MDVPGHFTFEAPGLGSFQFGLVQGDIDGRADDGPAKRVEFNWKGSDDGDDANGRGRAEIVDGRLLGHIHFHRSDDSAFCAERQQALSPGKAAT